jgi:hypothetical protein
MRMCCTCLLLGVFTCLVSHVLVYLTHAWVFVFRGVHAHARELRVPAFGCTHELDVTCACFPVHECIFVLGEYTIMRMCCACMLLGVFICLVLPALVSLSCAQVYVLGRVHAHARVVRVPALGCLHMLGVTCACLFDARVGVCDQGSTRACA